VDCIHPRADEGGFVAASQLYINPDECIDCGACESECPVHAIFFEDDVPEEYTKYIAINSEHYQRV
jgi:NAD-dependent dihydropyrimidine dehydrogenase PreA subunit